MDEHLNHLLNEVLEHELFDDDIIQQAQWVIADTIVATLYGLASEKEVVNFINGCKHSKNYKHHRFPILGTNLFTNIKDNLMIHGTAVVANELDEGNTFAKGHPSAHILPSVLISAFERNASTEKVLDAYIRAYEISSRLAYASNMYDEMHPHGTWGNVGGAIARALIEEKDKDAIKEIILIALSLPLSTAWLAAEKGQSIRNLYTGVGSFLAYESVNFQKYGFFSSTEVAENIWSTIMGQGMNLERLTDSLLDPPLIAKNYFKVHPTCRFTHAAIDAADQLMTKHPINTKGIEKVMVNTYNLAARCHTKRPVTKLQSKFSIPYAIACTIENVDMYQNYTTNLKIVNDLIEKVTVKESQKLTKLLPNQRAATVKIYLYNGSVYSKTIYNAKGEYTDRFNKQALLEKYENMLKNHYSDKLIKRLSNHILNIKSYSTFKEWLQANHLI